MPDTPKMPEGNPRFRIHTRTRELQFRTSCWKFREKTIFGESITMWVPVASLTGFSRVDCANDAYRHFSQLSTGEEYTDSNWEDGNFEEALRWLAWNEGDASE